VEPRIGHLFGWAGLDATDQLRFDALLLKPVPITANEVGHVVAESGILAIGNQIICQHPTLVTRNRHSSSSPYSSPLGVFASAGSSMVSPTLRPAAAAWPALSSMANWAGESL